MSTFIRPLKKAHLPSACPRQAFKITALEPALGFFPLQAGRLRRPPKCASAEPVLSKAEGSVFRAPCIWNLWLDIRLCSVEASSGRSLFDRSVNMVLQHPVMGRTIIDILQMNLGISSFYKTLPRITRIVPHSPKKKELFQLK